MNRKTPIQLNKQNIGEYVDSLLTQIPSFSGKDLTVSNVDEITEQTYVNYIFRATLEDEKPFDIYLRQSRDHVKAAPDKKVEADRVAYEAKILNLLCDIIPDLVPEVLHLDKANNVVILSDIRRGCPLLVNELVDGRTHPDTGSFFGDAIAKIHGETYGIPNRKVRGSKKANEDAESFHLGMRLEPGLKMEKDAVESLLKEGKTARSCLVLGDLASKNIFPDGSEVRFLDLERSFIGDPAFDPAFLFCHYLIEVKPENLTESIRFIQNFMDAYKKRAQRYMTQEEINCFENRVVRYLGITILYRLFGFYLVINVERKKDVWTKIARELLNETGNDLPEILKVKTTKL